MQVRALPGASLGLSPEALARRSISLLEIAYALLMRISGATLELGKLGHGLILARPISRTTLD